MTMASSGWDSTPRIWDWTRPCGPRMTRGTTLRSRASPARCTPTRPVAGAVAHVIAATALAAESNGDTKARRQRVQVVTGLRGCVAFWDFVQREPSDGQQRFTAHVPPGATNDFPLDAGNYIKDYWGRDARRRRTTSRCWVAGRLAMRSASQGGRRHVSALPLRAPRGCMIPRWTSKARASRSASSCGPSARAGTMRWRASGVKART